MSKQLKTTITKRFANQVTGGLGKPSKMPGTAYGIPAAECITGSKLRKVPGSTCSDCYALKGRYAFANVVNAEYLRLDRVQQALDDHAFRAVYVDCFAFLLSKVDWHRWHDAGDLQSVEHFELIVEICLASPGTRHWLPTREYKIVKDWLKLGNVIPANLCVRFSAHMVDGPAPNVYALPGVTTSGVTTSTPGNCHAQTSGSGHCDDCRACWDRTVEHVNYKLH
tara:strand:+ start:1042 stop:1713 length:672 start_codon:yes stop_codon:yes gene_type:complete